VSWWSITEAERERLLTLEQGSDEWHAARVGCIGGSLAGRLLSVTERTMPSFIDAICAEGGQSLDHIPAIAKGKFWEPIARSRYELTRHVVVREVGLVAHPVYGFVRCSPDGLVEEDGGIEIKRPSKRELHITALAGRCPEVHSPQVQLNLLCSGRAWWDFVSIKHDEPERYRFAVVRVLPNLGMHRMFEHKIRLVESYLA